MMRLISFAATKLNHIATLDISFNDSITFITGVNGSGKTSVLSAITALLTPNLEALAYLSYDSIAVTFETEGKQYTVSSSKTPDGEVSLKITGVRKEYVFQQFEEDPFSTEGLEVKSQYYASISSEASKSEVGKSLASVPTPMFLGLDRRYRGGWNLRTRVLMRRSARRRKRNVFGSSLGDSLVQAIGLAEDRFAEVQGRSSRFSAEFVRDLLLSLISISPVSPFGAIHAPTNQDRQLLEQAKKAIKKFPRVEGISADDVRSRMEPIIRDIGQVLESIPADTDIGKLSATNDKSRKIIDAVIRWSSYKPTLDQVTKVSGLITAYNDKVTDSSREIDRYIRLIDDFIGQTGKSIGFDGRGNLIVRTAQSTFGVEDLSSGEAQVFVLLTHLAFNQDALTAGVFLIDEPELSLHLTWQEILVGSLLRANDSLQYIMATHSPSVIIDRTDCAIDISRFSVQG